MLTFIKQVLGNSSQSQTRSRKNRAVRLGAEVMEDRKLFAIGAELVVPLNTANHEFESANASSLNGTHAVVWTVRNATTGERDIMGRVFNTGGAPLTPDFVVNNQVGRDDSNPTVAMDSNGNMWVAWDRTTAGSRDVLATRISNAGINLLGAPNTFIPIASSMREEYDPSIGCNRAGDFTVSYTVGTGNTDINQARFTAAGVPLGTVAVANTAQPERASSLSRNPIGDYVIAWQTDGKLATGAPNSDILARKFNNAGAVVTPVTPVASAAGLMETMPSASIDQGGNCIFAWESGPSTVSRDVLARRMTPAGALQPTFVISNVAAAKETRPSIALTPTSGQFAVVYESTAGGVTSSFVKEFNAANANVLTLNMGANRNTPVVSVGPNQQYIVTYTNLIGSASDLGLGVRRRHGQL
jgi:hypothetical protein